MTVIRLIIINSKVSIGDNNFKIPYLLKNHVKIPIKKLRITAILNERIISPFEFSM